MFIALVIVNWFGDIIERHIIFVFLFKCYSSNILHWLQAEMWENIWQNPS